MQQSLAGKVRKVGQINAFGAIAAINESVFSAPAEISRKKVKSCAICNLTPTQS
jgi:hypothetical protein